MRRNVVETILGGVVLIVAAFFLIVAVQRGEVRGSGGDYEITARFIEAGGLAPGSDVRISGVKIGTVTRRELDLETFEAVITLALDPDVSLPADTEGVVTGDGLLGGKYLRLIPGSAAQRIGPGKTLSNTRDFKSLEDSVSEIIFLATGGGN